MSLLGGPLLKIARLRAGMTQRELAERIGLPQSSIARWESGARQPSIDSFVEAVRACGLDPVASLHPLDRSNDAFIRELLDETPAERLRVQVAAASAVRPTGRFAAAAAVAAPGGGAEPFDPVPILRALEGRGARYVLVGRLAECIRGVPIVPVGTEVALCPEASDDNAARIAQALRDLGAARWTRSEQRPLEMPLADRELAGARRWWVGDAGGAVALVSAPHGTTGYGDLVRHATEESLASGLSVAVAALADLIRIADTAVDPADRVGLPSLRRAYELTHGAASIGESQPPPVGLENLFAEHGIASR